MQLFFPSSCHLFASDPVTLYLCLYESHHSSIIPSLGCKHMQGRVNAQLPLLTPHLHEEWALLSQIRRCVPRSLRAPARMEWLTCEMVTLFSMSWRHERDSVNPAGLGGSQNTATASSHGKQDRTWRDFSWHCCWLGHFLGPRRTRPSHQTFQTQPRGRA